MASRTRSTTNLHPVALEELTRLKRDLKAVFGISATKEEIASALIHGATVPQLAGMLMAFNREVQAAEEAAETSPSESLGT